MKAFIPMIANVYIMNKTNKMGTAIDLTRITKDQAMRRRETAFFSNRRGRIARIAFMHVIITANSLFS